MSHPIYILPAYETCAPAQKPPPVKKVEDIRDYFTYVGCGGMLMKRRVPEKIGIFDTRFNPAYFEDPDFSFRAHQAGFKIGWNIAAKLVHLPHQTLGKVNQKDKVQQFTKILITPWIG